MKTEKFGNDILLVDKPEGLTSFEVVKRVKRIAGTRKVGHSGTLDRFASGLLVICTGKMTRLTQYFLESDKRYRAVIQLGTSTETDDFEGEVIRRGSFEALTPDEVARGLSGFLGAIEQLPPQYSALKVQGKRASDRVRNGEEVILKTRQVSIHEIEFIGYDSEKGQVECEIACSKGTYIRSIARDLGEILGCGAYLAALRRLESGRFSVDRAATLEELEGFDVGDSEGADFRMSPLEALGDFSMLTVSEDAARRVSTGAFFQREEVICLEKKEKNSYVIVDEKKNLIAIADIDIDKWHINYRNVLSSGNKEHI